VVSWAPNTLVTVKATVIARFLATDGLSRDRLARMQISANFNAYKAILSLGNSGKTSRLFHADGGRRKLASYAART
jgi:hypothetical protein